MSKPLALQINTTRRGAADALGGLLRLSATLGHPLLEEGGLLLLEKRRRLLAGQDGLRGDQPLDLRLPLGAAVVEGALDPRAVRLDGVELHLLLHRHGLGVRLHARGVLLLLVRVPSSASPGWSSSPSGPRRWP